MQLSINAIIVLVIAMLVLGLGLGLVTGVLGIGGDTLAATIQGYRLEVPASSSTPIIVSDPLELERGESNVVFTNVYNRNSALCDDEASQIGAWLYLYCPDISFERMQTQVIDVPVGSQESVGIVIDVPQDIDAGSYPCTIHVYCEERGARTQNGIITNDHQQGTIESKSLFVRVI